MKKLFNFFSIVALMLFLAGCDNDNSNKHSSDSLQNQLNADTSELKTTDNDTAKTQFAALDANEAKAMIKHYKHTDVDANRKKGFYANFDPALLNRVFGPDEEIEYCRIFFAAYYKSSDGERKNWPTLVIKVKSSKKTNPEYFIATGICPPPEGTCEETIE